MTDHFGDPFREQRSLAQGAAVVPLENHGVIRLSGKDRLTWLDSLVSQDVSTLVPGNSAECLLLDPQGRIEQVVRVFDDGEQTWLLIDDHADSFVRWLDSMVFRRDVSVVDASQEFTTVGLMTGESAESELLSIAAQPNGPALTWRDPWPTVSPGGWQYHHGDKHPAGAWNYMEVLIDASGKRALDRLVDEGSLQYAGTLALEALRIAAWRPASCDVDATSLPHEFDWLRSAVHLSKGCYRGQETVAKVHNLGRPPRRLVFLDLDGSGGLLPAAGSPVALSSTPDSPVGHITSSSRHFEDGPIALALVRRATPIDEELIVLTDQGDRMVATAIAIVPPDAGKAVEVPRITRQRARPSRS